MISSINSNISSLQLLRAQNAFAQARKAPEIKELSPVEEFKEDTSLPKAGTTLETLQNKIVDEIRDDLTNINQDITDEDIKYGLTFGRSVFVDCSA